MQAGDNERNYIVALQKCNNEINKKKENEKKM